MYERRRKGGKKWGYVGLGGALALLRVATAGSSSSPSPYGTPTQNSVDGSAVALIGGLFVGVPAIIGIGNLVSFSEEREQKVDQAYRSGQPLPASVRRQLKKKDFN
jgi:hypothetical protein